MSYKYNVSIILTFSLEIFSLQKYLRVFFNNIFNWQGNNKQDRLLLQTH